MTDQAPDAAFAEALAAFQSEIPHIAKGQKANAGTYSYSYADLTDITQAAAPLLSKHGLAFTAAPTVTEHGFVLNYALLHTSGHREGGMFPLPDTSKFSAQQIGSWLTYARRYALCAVTGIAPGGDDDDAQKAGDARSVDISAPKRAQRTNARDINPATDPDPFAAPVVTDAAWIEGFRSRLTACTKASEVRGLDSEAKVQFGAGKLSADDAKILKAEIDGRMQELTGALV